MAGADKLVFRGTDTNDSECEDFVEAVRRFAFDQGKQHDNQWIVDLVHKSLVGDALRWHVTLPQEVQNDWYLLQQALMAQFPVVFRGIGGVECDSFVRHVRRKAVNEGKLQDPAWMANYAAGAFAGDALRWYDTLDKETKGNWDLLQTALFLKYPASDVQSPLSHFSRQGASTTITSPAPIPAAAPVPLGQGRFAPGVTAFIEVTADGGPELSGHVSRFLQTDGRHVVTKLKSERLCVLAVASEKQYRLKLVDPTVPHGYLGLKWTVDRPDLVSKYRAMDQYAGLVTVSDPDNVPNESSATELNRPIACLLWEVAPDGLLTPVWEGFKLRIGMYKLTKYIWMGEPRCSWFSSGSQTPVELHLVPV